MYVGTSLQVARKTASCEMVFISSCFDAQLKMTTKYEDVLHIFVSLPYRIVPRRPIVSIEISCK